MAPSSTNVSGITMPGSGSTGKDAMMAQLATMSPDDPRRMQLLAMLQQQGSMA
jgi:hypothetical protein